MTFDYPAYMEALAKSHSLIKHSPTNHRFYKMTSIALLEEVLTRLLTAKTPAIGINDSAEGRLYNNKADRTIDRQLYTYYVFGRSPLFDHATRKVVIKQCKEIASDFALRILNDHHSDFNLSTNNGLRHLDVESFTYRAMGNLPDGLICVLTSFVLDSPFNSSNDPWE
jgi:hypothetical protein